MTEATRSTLPTWLKLMAFVQIGFALMIGFGASFEVANLTRPDLFPALQDNPIARVHHSEPVVFWWTLLSNLIVVAIAITFARGAIALLRRDDRGRRRTRLAALSLIAISIGGAIVSAISLVPLIRAGFASTNESDRVSAVLFVSMLASSVLFVPMYPVVALFVLGRERIKAYFA